MKSIHFFIQSEGTSVLEFAIIFPLVMLLTFSSLVLIFWLTDAMITTYEVSRLNRLESVNVNLISTDDVYLKLAQLPTVNKFQDTTVVEEIVYNADLTLIKTSLTSTTPSLTPYLLKLILAGPGELRSNLFQTLRSTSYRIKESYIVSAP